MGGGRRNSETAAAQPASWSLLLRSPGPRDLGFPCVREQSRQRAEMQISRAQGLFQLHSKMRQGRPKDKAMGPQTDQSLSACRWT